ncbi:MAG: hypothetical protein HYV27_13535 [Candidatus Hydrogenedentes bacterium]|nr:hypothetical protein [Candidatus Hydrogenedentota bacterium]
MKKNPLNFNDVFRSSGAAQIIPKSKIEKALRESGGDLRRAARQCDLTTRELLQHIVEQGISPEYIPEQVICLQEG